MCACLHSAAVAFQRSMPPMAQHAPPWRSIPPWRAFRSSGSTAQPATAFSSAGRFAQSWQERKRSRKDSSSAAGDGTLVGYIGCPQELNCRSNRDRRKLLQAVEDMIDAGATIINIVLRPESIHAVLTELKATFDELWPSSVAQPAYTFRCMGSMMSFFTTPHITLLCERNIHPEDPWPALHLTFDTPDGLVSTVITSLPRLPARTRARLMKTYTDAAAETNAPYSLIGGMCSQSMLFLENQIAQLQLEHQLFTHGDLYLLANDADCSSFESDELCSLMVLCGRQQELNQATGSAERPASSHDSVAQPIIPRRDTPLYNDFLEHLEIAVEEHARGEGLLMYITDCCFFGDLLSVDEFGESVAVPMQLSEKMEMLLEAAFHQRELQLHRLRNSAEQPVVTDDRHMTDEDMKDIYNTWRKDVESWMKDSTLVKHQHLEQRGKRHLAQQLEKSCFSSYLFQLSGCKFLLHRLIELPIRNVEQPTALLEDLIYAYEIHKTTAEYRKTVERSQKNQIGQMRLSHEIWWAQQRYYEGRKLAHGVRDGTVDFYKLAWSEQKDVEDFDTGRSAKEMDRLLKQKRPPYRGSGSVILAEQYRYRQVPIEKAEIEEVEDVAEASRSELDTAEALYRTIFQNVSPDTLPESAPEAPFREPYKPPLQATASLRSAEQSAENLVPRYDSRAHGDPGLWWGPSAPFRTFSNKHRNTVWSDHPVLDVGPDINHIYHWLRKRPLNDQGENCADRLGTPSYEGAGWFRFPLRSFDTACNHGSAEQPASSEWKTAWHGTPAYAIPQILRQGLRMSGDKARKDRFFADAPGIYCLPTKLRHVTFSYQCASHFPSAPGIFWQFRLELKVDRNRKHPNEGKHKQTGQWIQLPGSVVETALHVKGDTLRTISNSERAYLHWDSTWEAMQIYGPMAEQC